MTKINTQFLLTINAFYKYGLKENDINQSIRRIKRIFKTQEISPDLFDDAEPIVEHLLNKYSILTVIQTLKLIVIIYTYYGNTTLSNEYVNQLENIIDMKTNSDMYSKLTNNDIETFIDKNYEKFMGGNICFSKFRHFLLLALLIKEIPLRFPTITNITFKYHTNTEDSDCIRNVAYLVKNQNGSFTFYFNLKKDGKQMKQIKYDIKDTKVRMLLTHYFVKYAKNLNYLFTTSGGKRCSDSNIANSLSNFCRLYFKVPLTLGEIRAGFPKNTRDLLKKEIFENF